MATRLIASVDDDDEYELSPAWRAEIDRRVAAIKNGTATLIPHDEAMDSARKLIASAAQS
jgi:putative addiction module component (TIGR02574 family)